MQQIMNYLSNKYDIKRALLFSATKEFKVLEKWLQDVKGIQIIYPFAEAGQIEETDAIIFDYECGQVPDRQDA